MQNDSRVVKVGDVVAWADVPDGALARSQSSYTWWYLHCGEHGCVVGIRGTKDGGAWWPWGAAGTTPKWLGWSCADHPVTIVAMGLTGEETAEHLRALAERFEMNAALDRMTEEGAKIWADVPDAAAWVRDLRGRDEDETT